jgi:amino acid adenylation domain-containing protein
LSTGVEYVAARNGTEQKLVAIWEEVLGKTNIGIRDNFFESGGDSLIAIRIINRLQKEFKEIFQLATLFECPTPEFFAQYIFENKSDQQAAVIDQGMLNEFRKSIKISKPQADTGKLPRVIFILSPPRSGSTLLRVIMGGNKMLFSPPELELAGFSTMKDRATVLSGKFEFLKEGLLRSVMELKGCDVNEAKAMVSAQEKEEESISTVYGWLQQQIGQQILVDKTPSYAYSIDTLRSIEDIIDNAFYIHLVRSPQSSVLSYEEAKMDQIYRYKASYNRREMAELEWVNCHDNILRFLKDIPEERHCRLNYEALVNDPKPVVEKLCRELEIGFDENMLSVYENGKKKMTDGLHKESKMIGDLKFSSHQKIDNSAADRWKKTGIEYKLGDVTIDVALKLGYKRSQLIIQKPAEIKKASPALHYPLSSAQKRFWVLSRFEEGNIAYNMPGVYVFEGDLNSDYLEAAFKKLIERHEILRTVFKEDEQGDIRQFIKSAEAFDFIITSHDLRAVLQREDHLKKIVRSEIMRAFNLTEGPVLRAGLYQMEDYKWVFCFVMHHIAGDGWSMGVLIKELLQFYNALANNAPVSFMPLRIQYKDYAVSQQQQLNDNAFEEHREYWLSQFNNDLPVLELPSDRPRPAVKTYNGGLVHKMIDTGTAAGFKLLNREQGTTLFMGLLAAVNTLLYRYSGQEDLIIGSPVAGREKPELEDQIGLYLNTLALRSEFSGNDSYRELLQRVKQTTLNAYEHQAYPFDELVDELKLKHDLSRNALFDVMVVLLNTEAGINKNSITKLDTVNVSSYESNIPVSSKFDLTFNFTAGKDDLKLSIQYNSDLYDAGTIERMSGHLEGILKAVVKNAAIALNDIEYIPEQEKNILLSRNNVSRVAYPECETIVSLFECQVRETPANIAIVAGDVQMSYSELNERSNRLAHYLRINYAIQPDDRISILLGRDERMIIAILAILKSGAAYVPVDPEYPEERINYIREDSNCKLLVDTEFLEKFRNEEEKYSALNLEKINKPSDLAYVIYTSGTTGNPKGVMIEHRNVVRLFKTDQPLFDFSVNDVWTMFHSYCFDFSVWEMYGAVLYGGKLVIVPVDTAKDPVAFHRLIADHNVTVVNQTPSAFYNLQDAAISNDLQLSVRYVIFGGEALSPGKINKWNEKYPETKLINMYGITETTVHVTYKEITNIEIGNKKSNIGIPISTLCCYVLDANKKIVPAGVEGELYVGGAGLARGYLNRPELTAERFVDNPYKPGERLYRSGDNVKISLNGEMEYIGRKDQQVKVRGYRIELGEIENALLSDLRIDTAIVLTIAGAETENNLVAYIVSSAKLNITELRMHLTEKLPLYMIPDHFIQLDAVPLTPNGKIDRKKLPLPQGSSMASGIEYVAPRNETEERLVKLWEEVLDRDRIGVMDNFFELGGHSLKATRLLSKISREFELSIELKDVFHSPTIEKLALKINFIKWNLVGDDSLGSKDEIEIEL